MKILVIVSRIPYPLEKGDKLRAYHQVRELSKNHEICLCCLSDQPEHPEAREKLREICSELHIIHLNKAIIYLNLLLAWFESRPFQVAYFHQRKAQKAVQRIVQRFAPDHIYCQLVRTAEYVKNEHGISKTIDYQDAFSKGMARRAERESNYFKKKFFQTEARRLIRYEHLIFDYFNNKCIISEQDKALIFHENQREIAVIPNGVDMDFFHPMETSPSYDLCFVGNMSYAPNVDSVLYLHNEVMPLVWREMPEVKVLIAGATPAEAITRLHQERFEVGGWFEDIRDAYRRSRLFVAPMQIGTGLQNKLLEAMAMGIPCITSKLANDALGATHDQHLMVGSTPEDYAHHIIALLKNLQRGEELARNARLFVQQNYTWQSSVVKLEGLFASS